MSIYKPYTYLIGWSKLNTWYYGVRFSSTANPFDLWVTYFTSSKHVKEFRLINGEPDIIQIRKTFNDKHSALLWEHRVLCRLKVHKLKKFLNVSRGFGLYFSDATGTTQSEEHKRKKADSHRGQKHPTAGPKISAKRRGKATVIDKNGKMIQVSVNDPRYISRELKPVGSGMIPVKDGDGIHHYVSNTDPRYLSGEVVAISKGRIPSNKIHYLTEEELEIENIKKLNDISTSRKNLIWINNGLTRTRIQPEMFDLYYRERNWNLGRKFPQ